MTTAQQVFELAMDLIEERLDSGLVSASDTISYKVRTPGILTMLQSELIKQGDLFKSYEISNYPLTNLLGFITNFDIKQFEGEDLTFEAQGKARSYYFEVDKPATVYIEEFVSGTWNVLATIEANPTESGFTAYKGLVTPSENAVKSRFRFSGSYYYRTINRALFSASFANVNDIPNYQPWTPIEMPSDFKSVNEIIEEHTDRQYTQSTNYKWEGRNKLFINYYFMGKIRVIYRPVPTPIAMPSVATDPMTTELQLDDVTSTTILPYGLAAHLMLQENPSVASYLNSRFEELKFMASKQPPSAFEQITNSYV